MPTIKRVIDVHFSVQANTPLSELDTCYVSLHKYDLGSSGFTTLAVRQVEIEINTDKFVENALKDLDATEHVLRAEFQNKLDKLQAARANLLSLPAPTAPAPQPDVIDFVVATLDFDEAEEHHITRVFYVTYGGNTLQRNNFSRVFAVDYSSARELLHEKIGDKFASCYNESEFNGQIEKYGLSEIPLTAQQRATC